jgi:hypothetical protein
MYANDNGDVHSDGDDVVDNGEGDNNEYDRD